MYDFLIVGSGLFGSVFAREMTDKGLKCLVIDKRNNIGGNVFTEKIEGINVHKYGAHIFHTNDLSIWNHVNKFAKFNDYRHKVFVKSNEKLFSFPINLMTLNQIWGIIKPEDAVEKLKSLSRNNGSTDNLEDWILSQIGEELYNIFVKGYTQKQWGRDPKNLPASIIKRIPIRTTFNDFYFDDKYQGIPEGGYTQMIANMLTGIEVKLGVNYIPNKYELDFLAKNIVYTGAIDEFFNYEHGILDYRSVDFVHSIENVFDFQGTSVINYTDSSIPFTRILEHKHFEFGKQPMTVITKEYPSEWAVGKEPYYPLTDDRNLKIYNQYKKKSELFPNIIFGGRLAEYKYYDMHQVVGSALQKAKKLIINA